MEQKKPQTYYDVWKYGMKGCYYGTDAELVDRLSCVEVGVRIRLLDVVTLIRDNDDLHLIMTSPEKPVMAWNGFGLSDSLCIEPKVYRANPEKYKMIIIKLIEAMQCDRLSIEPEIQLSYDILAAIVRNNNIKTVSLGRRLLTSELYSVLKTKPEIEIMSDNIAGELQEIYDGTIFENLYRKIAGDYNYSSLQSASSILLNQIYSEKELDAVFAYTPNLKSIKVSDKALGCLNYIMSKKGERDIDIILELDERVTYDVQNLKEISAKYPDIKVKYGTDRGVLDDYIKAELALAELLKPIEGLELSPLEKFIFAFNTCKRFREYKENEDDKLNARNIIELFKEGNEHIVCVGFANILAELCKRLNIASTDVGLTVHKILPNNEVERLGAHARNFVRITDPKYGLDNMYMSDATWSNDYEFDSLVTALMTPYETLQLRRMVQFGETSIITAQTYEEFLDTIYVEFRSGKHFNFDKTLEYISRLYPEFLEGCLSNPAYNQFKTKAFADIEDYRLLFSDDAFMSNLFQFIQLKSNQPISGDILIEASVNLYRKLNPSMSMEEIEIYRKKLIEDNYHVYNQQVPAIVTEYSDGSKNIIENAQNKFGQGPRKI